MVVEEIKNASSNSLKEIGHQENVETLTKVYIALKFLKFQ